MASIILIIAEQTERRFSGCRAEDQERTHMNAFVVVIDRCLLHAHFAAPINIVACC